MVNLILSSIRKRKISSLSLLLTVIVGVALIFSVSLLNAGVNQGVELSKERGGAEIIIVPSKASNLMSDDALIFTGAPAQIYMPASVADEVSSIQGVERSSVQFFAQTLSAGCCSIGEEKRIVGYDSSSDWLLQALTDVDISSGLTDDQVIVGSAVHDPSDDPDSLYLGGKSCEVVAQLAETETGIDDCIFVNMDFAHKMTLLASEEDQDGMWDDQDPDSVISAVLVDVDDSLDEYQSSDVFYDLSQIEGVRVIQRDSVIDNSKKQLTDVFGVMMASGVLMVILCLVQLFSRFYSMAWDRKSELSLYRALGASVSQISKLIIGEAAILGGLGVAIGIIAGVGLYFALQTWLTGLSTFPYVSPSIIQMICVALVTIVVFALAVIISIVAPLRQISRIDPSLAMQQSDID